MLIKEKQIENLVSLHNLVDEINASYPANKVTTTVEKTPASGDDPAVNYTGQELLSYLKTAVDGILGGGGEGESLVTLANKIAKVSAELNGGSYLNEEETVTLDGFKNKPIRDVIRVVFNTADGSTATAATLVLPTALPDTLVNDAQNDRLPAYVSGRHTFGSGLSAKVIEDNQRIVGIDGSPITFNTFTGKFSAAPYVLDIEGTKDSGGISATGEIIQGSAVYIPFTGSFKIFPQGEWTLETLPTDALLDNGEMQILAYEEALQKIVLQLSMDKQLIERITQAIDLDAIKAAVDDATEKIDTRIDRLEGVAGADSDLSRVAVKVSQIEGAPAITGDNPVVAETVTKTTKITSKKYVDDAITAANNDIGRQADRAAYNTETGEISAGTVRGEIGTLKDHYLSKDILVQTVKPNVLANTAATGQTPVYDGAKVVSTTNTISEEALVTKFTALDSEDARISTRLENYIVDAHQDYVDHNEVTDIFTKITGVDSGNGTKTYTPAAYETFTNGADKTIAVGRNVFNVEVSKLQDRTKDLEDTVYFFSGIQTADAVTANPDIGLTAKEAEAAATATTPVPSKQYVDNASELESKTRAKADADIDAKTYDWNKITVYDGTAISTSVPQTTFNAITGATADATQNEIVKAAGTAETADENIVVLSAAETQARIDAAKETVSRVEAYDKQELTNRIAYEAALRERHIDIEIKRLTADIGDTLAAAGNGEAAVTATAKGSIKDLQDTVYHFADIQTGAGIGTAITYGEGAAATTLAAVTAAEGAPTQATKVTSKQYVDDSVSVAKANVQLEVLTKEATMDARVTKLEKVTDITERIAPDLTESTIALSHVPFNNDEIYININGIMYNYTDGVFSINNGLITWLSANAGFSLSEVLDTNGRVVVSYRWLDNNKAWLTSI